MRGFQPQLAQQFAQKKKRANYAEGGPVRGPGTGTSDEVQDVVPEGTYIMPTDSTQAIGEEQLAAMGQEQLPVNLSNGEFKMPPEQVHAVGVQALDQMKGATHTPAPEGMGNPAKGVKPELFFADGGVATTKKKKASDSPSDAGDASGNSGSGDASAAPSSTPPSSVPGADGVMRQGNSYSAAPAVPATSDAARQSAVNQIPTGGHTAPPFDGGPTGQVAGAVNNTMNALGGMGVVASVPLRAVASGNAAASTAPMIANTASRATPLLEGAGNAARGAADFISGMGAGATTAAIPRIGMAATEAVGTLPKVNAALQEGAQANALSGAVRAASGASAQATSMDARNNPYQAPQAAGASPAALEAASSPAAAQGKQASGLDAPWYSREYVTAANMSDKSGLQLEADRAKQGASLNIPSDDPLQRALRTGTASLPKTASEAYNFPNAAGAGRGSVNPPNAFHNAVVPSIAKQSAQNSAKPAAPAQQVAAGAEPVPMLPRDEYRKMTNAQVMEANPNGAVKAVKDANGQWSFSGGSVSGDVSYVGADNKPLAGGGLNGKGFKGIDIAPAGAHIAFGGGDNYAFSREAPAPTGERKWGATGNTMNGVAIPDGMGAAQAVQYSKEVLAAQSAAQTSARGAQIVSAMQGSKAMRDWNDLRSPEGIAKRNLETAMNNYPPGQRGGKPTVAQQAAAEAYKNLATGQFQKANNEGGVATDNQRYADGQRRANQQDANTERAYQDSRADAAPVREAREQENKARGISVRQAEQAEAARDGYVKALDSGDEKAAATSLEKLKALSGIDGKDSAKWKMHSGPSSKDENGIVTPGETYLYNASTGETRGVGGDSGALPPIGENPKVAAIMKNTKLSMDERKQQVRELGYK